MNTTKRPWLIPAALTAGALLIVVRWWLHRLTDDDPAPLGLVVPALVATLVAAGVVALALAHRNRTLHAAVLDARPNHRTASGWSDASLGGALAQIGVTQRFRAQGGAPVVLAWSRDGLELWRAGSALVLTVGWDEVTRVGVIDGVAAALPRPAIAIGLRAGTDLVIVPARQESGGLLPATPAQTSPLFLASAR